MPMLVIGPAMAVLGAGAAVFWLKKTGRKVRIGQREAAIAVFFLSLIALAISLKLFWNMGQYADEYGSSPVLVCGGWFWLSMDWVRQGVLLVVCVISGLGLLRPPGESRAG